MEMKSINIHQDDLIKIICNEEEWESNGLNPTKGLFLIGNAGVGKTTAINEFLRACRKNPGWRIDDQKIMEGVQIHGNQYFSRFLQDNMFWDDMGEEPQRMMWMGTDIWPGVSILKTRYTRWPHLKNHFTSNMSIAQLKDYYGDKVMSRLAQMCNFINVTGKDRRL
jgi:hypothetical protein